MVLPREVFRHDGSQRFGRERVRTVPQTTAGTAGGPPVRQEKAARCNILVPSAAISTGGVLSKSTCRRGRVRISERALAPLQDRLRWYRRNLASQAGWSEDFHKLPGGWNRLQIARALAHALGGREPTEKTITNDIRRLQADLASMPDTEAAWDDEILAPENFVQWRARAFFNSDEGIPYETPRHQEAWFWVIATCALSSGPPELRMVTPPG